MAAKPEEKSSNAAFGGSLKKYAAKSSALGGLETNFNVFVPETQAPVPVLYYLAGLTCNEDTGAQKGGFLRDAAQHGIALVFPDTSPRGAGVAGEEDDWDFGTGAGFYLNATAEKYSKHYNMARFITEELPSLLKQTGLPLDLSRASIFGHSMGGHGALSLYLLNPSLYRSASAFAPIAHPTQAPWGDKAFKGYLKGGVEEGKALDTTELLLSGKADGRKLAIKVDTGTGDQFYKQNQLHPEDLIEAAKKAGKSSEIDVQLRDGYDHSYWFISTFGPDHVAFHAKHLA